MNCRCSLAFVPIPSSLDRRASCARRSRRLREVDRSRRIENGSASTTWSATHVERRRAAAERERVAAVGVALDRGQLRADRDLAAPSVARARAAIWSLPPRTWYFSFDLPKIAELARPDVAEQVEHVERALHVRLGAVLDVVGDVEQLAERRAVAAGHVLRRSSGRSTSASSSRPRCVDEL